MEKKETEGKVIIQQAVDHKKLYIYHRLREAKELMDEIDKVNRMTEKEFEDYENRIGINTYYMEEKL